MGGYTRCGEWIACYDPATPAALADVSLVAAGGEFAAIARAFVTWPDILLIDEPVLEEMKWHIWTLLEGEVRHSLRVAPPPRA